MHRFITLSLLALLATEPPTCSAQTANPGPTPPNPAPVRGPFFSGTIGGPRSRGTVALKGIVVTLGTPSRAYVCFDTDSLTPSVGWTGEYLEFQNTLTKIEWPPPPFIKGSMAFGTRPLPGWTRDLGATDPRPRGQGPLPESWARYRGLYQHGREVVFAYSVGATGVRDHFGFAERDGSPIFIRTLEIEPATHDLNVLIHSTDAATTPTGIDQGTVGSIPYSVSGDRGRIAVALISASPDTSVLRQNGNTYIQIKPHTNPVRLSVALSPVNTEGALDKFKLFLASPPTPRNLAELCQGGPAQWPEPEITKGQPSSGQEPYVVDTLVEPFPNRWNTRTFFGGFDFFPDGRAALCTFHGDVWIVSGIDDTLSRLTWRRFATGLFQRKKWKKQSSGTSALLTGVYFIDQKTGWVTGAAGTLRQSVNGGESWTGHPLETQQPLYGIHFPSATDGWVVGGGGTILHTADGGAHWVEQASGTSASLYAVQFLDAQRGTAVGALGTVLATRDGGRTWVPQVSQGAVTLFDVYFTDESTGWAVGNAGALFQTNDGGAKWVDRTLPCGKTCTKVIDLLKVRFTSPQEGWIVGERGMMYRTTDAGYSWSDGTPIAPVSLFGLTFSDAAHGWASGENGTVVHLQAGK